MKTIKSFIVLIGLVLSMNSFAADHNDALNQCVQKELKSRLSVKIEKSEKVCVVFTTDATGKVNLAIAKTADKLLKQAIEANFMKMQFSHLKSDVAYSVVLDLQLV